MITKLKHMSKSIFYCRPINLEDSAFIAEKVTNLLAGAGLTHKIVGSLGKVPISGDVDVIVNCTIPEFFNKFPWLYTDHIKISSGFHMISMPMEFVGYDYGPLRLDIFCIQDMRWGEFIMSAGTKRNQLMMAALISKTKEQLFSGSPNEWLQLNIRVPSGVWLVHKTDLGTSGTKLTKSRIIKEEFVSDSPSYIASILGCTVDDLNSFDRLYELFKDDQTVMDRFNNHQINK